MSTQSFSLPNLEWCNLPAGRVTITRNGYIDYGPQAGKSYSTKKAFNVASCLISRAPITNDQYQMFVDAPDGYTNRSWWRFHVNALKWRGIAPYPPHFPQGNDPRTNVSWWDALAFCRWLSAKTGQTITLPQEEAWVLAARTPPAGFERDNPDVWEWCLGEKGPIDDLPSSCFRKDRTTRREINGLTSHPDLGFRVCQLTSATTASPTDEDLLTKVKQATYAHHRQKLLNQLALRNSMAAVPYLIELVQNSESPFTELPYLGLFGDEQATDLLLQLLEHPQTGLQCAAADALGNLADPKAIPALLKALHAENVQFRSAAMNALLRIDAEIFEILLDLAQNESNPGIRKQAISALSRFHYTPAIEQARSQLTMIVQTTTHEPLRTAAQKCLDAQHTPFVNPHGFAS